MANRPRDGTSVQIVVALIGVAGVIAAALLGNWDKIFGESAAPTQTSAPAVTVANTGSGGAAPPAQATSEVENLSAAQTRAFEAGTNALEGVARQIEGATIPSISGVWLDSDGYIYLVEQSGSAFSYVQMNLDQPVGTGQGTIAGRVMRYGYTSAGGNGSCVGEVAPDQRSITGRCTAENGVSWPFRVAR